MKHILGIVLLIVSTLASAQPYYRPTGGASGVASAITTPCATANAVLFNAAAPCSANLTFNGTALSLTAAGTSTATVLNFGVANRGLYAIDTDQMGYSVGGAASLSFSSNGIHLASNTALSWSLGVNNPATTTDLFLSRSAARLVMISGDGIGASGTNFGIKMGNAQSGFSIITNSAIAVPDANSPGIVWGTAGDVYLTSGIGQSVTIRVNSGAATKGVFPTTAGAGLALTAGTAATDVAALSLTRTNNDVSVATGVKFTFTDTSSAAGFLPFQILGGAAGTTNLFSIAKDGTATTGSVFANYLVSTIGQYYNRGSNANYMFGVGDDTSLSRISAGLIGVGTGAAGNTDGTIRAKVLGTPTGYTVAGLPAAVAGDRTFVTDQLTTCAVVGAVLTGAGAVKCPVFYNGTAWVGG